MPRGPNVAALLAVGPHENLAWIVMDSLHPSASPRSENGMPTSSFAAALIAAAAGASTWAAVGYFTGYEVGYVAWAIGGLVGFAMARFGGRGTTCALTAAALSLAGIAAGKLLGTHFVAEKALQESCDAAFTPALHEEFVRDAADFAELGADAGDDELRTFMVEHSYTAATSPEEVQDEELVTFRSTNAPNLLALHAGKTSYADWYTERVAESRKAFEEDFSIVQANLEELNAIDLLFAFLGVSTAFGIVRRASDTGAGQGGQGTTSAGDQEARKAA
jgi:hypothetical protein